MQNAIHLYIDVDVCISDTSEPFIYFLVIFLKSAHPIICL